MNEMRSADEKRKPAQAETSKYREPKPVLYISTETSSATESDAAVTKVYQLINDATRRRRRPAITGHTT